ncbi:hypothetical protein C8Q72DRAFT_875263 [Fomitopsis betulina]|nr:hypothetical protein C8Q72DRAFT_875263 [Fomitopsis betulina]
MQELILHAHTAYRLNRTFVWYDYEWNPDGSQYTFYNGKRMPSRIPLSAFVQGVLVGAQPRTDDNAVAPIGVAEGYFDAVCPKHTRQQVTVEDIFALIGHEPTTASLLEKTLEVISPMPENSLILTTLPGSLFGDGHRLLDDWAALSKSPILQEFFWSSLVESAFDWNRKVFSSVPDEIPQLGTAPLYSYSYNASPSASRYIPISGLLALHIRLGDFEKHCTGLAKWRSSYVGFNSFPELPDHFAPPSDSSEAERIAQYRPRCLVSVADVVRRVREVREVEWAAGRELRDVYLMTNAPEEWIAEAKATLRDMDGPQWRSIASSRDLVAVDMLVGQRAQVFVGNGFSSLSGLITMFRMANGVPPNQTRFF